MEIRNNPFSDPHNSKTKRMLQEQLALTRYHMEHCAPYRQMIEAQQIDIDQIHQLEDIPFLPVSLFKKVLLSSISDEQETFQKVITSSGTTGQKTSQIILDGETRTNQQRVLSSIVSDFLGNDRIPMLVIDCPAIVKKRDHFSARTAGILGFSLFGRNRTFALRDDMSLDQEAVQEFLNKYGKTRFLVYGFTFLVWKYFVAELEKHSEMAFDMSNGIMIHGGGWKKLQDEAVSKAEFQSRIQQICGLSRVYDYYGMAEQSGSIFMECEHGHLHCSDYSEVLIRRGDDFSLCNTGERGLIQVMSVIPGSYPGHSLLTEDEGMILGTDDCPCGRKGTYFQVFGRVRQAELRGCSDTFDVETQQKDGGFRWVLGSQKLYEQLEKQESWPAFSETAITFLAQVSEFLMADDVVRREMPDVMAFAFWCRARHLEALRAQYDTAGRTGRGICLHYAASNVPTLSGYSLAAGILAGNCCVMRMPRRSSVQETVLIQAMEHVMTYQMPEMRNRILLCRYGHDPVINEQLSAISKARIMWGNDASIRSIQQISAPEECQDIAFGTRYSACVFLAEEIMGEDDLLPVIRAFYNDTYLNDQNACSSPRVVYWLGTKEQCTSAQIRFWNELHQFLIQSKYQVPETIAVEKRAAAFALAATGVADRIVYGSAVSADNRILRVSMHDGTAFQWDQTVPGGFFIEITGEDISGLSSILDESFQTLTVYGCQPEKIKLSLTSEQQKKIKRAVPIGHALDFSLTWDGHDLIEELTIKNENK